MINARLVAKYFAEASYIFTGKAGIHLAIFAKLTVHQVVFAFNTCYLETIRHQLHKHIDGYGTLWCF